MKGDTASIVAQPHGDILDEIAVELVDSPMSIPEEPEDDVAVDAVVDPDYEEDWQADLVRDDAGADEDFIPVFTRNWKGWKWKRRTPRTQRLGRPLQQCCLAPCGLLRLLH